MGGGPRSEPRAQESVPLGDSSPPSFSQAPPWKAPGTRLCPSRQPLPGSPAAWVRISWSSSPLSVLLGTPQPRPPLEVRAHWGGLLLLCPPTSWMLCGRGGAVSLKIKQASFFLLTLQLGPPAGDSDIKKKVGREYADHRFRSVWGGGKDRGTAFRSVWRGLLGSGAHPRMWAGWGGWERGLAGWHSRAPQSWGLGVPASPSPATAPPKAGVGSVWKVPG